MIQPYSHLSSSTLIPVDANLIETLNSLPEYLLQVQEDLPVTPPSQPFHLLPTSPPMRIGLMFLETSIYTAKSIEVSERLRKWASNELLCEDPAPFLNPATFSGETESNSNDSPSERSLPTPYIQETLQIENLLLPLEKKEAISIDGFKNQEKIINKDAKSELPQAPPPEAENENIIMQLEEAKINFPISILETEEINREILDQKPKEACSPTLSLGDLSSTLILEPDTQPARNILAVFPSLLNEKVGLAIDFFQNKA